jgi:hypothetical protein
MWPQLRLQQNEAPSSGSGSEPMKLWTIISRLETKNCSLPRRKHEAGRVSAPKLIHTTLHTTLSHNGGREREQPLVWNKYPHNAGHYTGYTPHYMPTNTVQGE